MCEVLDSITDTVTQYSKTKYQEEWEKLMLSQHLPPKYHVQNQMCSLAGVQYLYLDKDYVTQ